MTTTIETEKRFMRRYVVETAAPRDEICDALVHGLTMKKGYAVYIDCEPMPTSTRKARLRLLADHIIRWMFVVYGFVIGVIALWEWCKAAMR